LSSDLLFDLSLNSVTTRAQYTLHLLCAKKIAHVSTLRRVILLVLKRLKQQKTAKMVPKRQENYNANCDNVYFRIKWNKGHWLFKKKIIELHLSKLSVANCSNAKVNLYKPRKPLFGLWSRLGNVLN
jgi:hypothetical protein